MPLSTYDCPTFLGQKDKYLAGLSLPQLMAGLAVGFAWFLLSLMLPYSVIVRIFIVLPVTGVTMALMFVRISGVSIPVYALLALQRTFSRPSYEALGPLVVWGDEEWLEGERLKADSRRARRRRGLFGFGKLRGGDAEARKVELQAELDRQVSEGSVAVEQMVRDGVRTLVKGS